MNPWINRSEGAATMKLEKMNAGMFNAGMFNAGMFNVMIFKKEKNNMMISNMTIPAMMETAEEMPQGVVLFIYPMVNPPFSSVLPVCAAWFPIGDQRMDESCAVIGWDDDEENDLTYYGDDFDEEDELDDDLDEDFDDEEEELDDEIDEDLDEDIDEDFLEDDDLDDDFADIEIEDEDEL